MPTQETTGSSPDTEPTGAIQSASEMKAGDRVVYPKQGVCRVLGLESKEIAGQRLEFISMAREEDNATILVPVPKVASIGLRKVADTSELADVFDLLASSFDDPELDWKVRHRLHGDLLSAGGILGVAEVLKALQGLANLRPLPQKERERYDMARHLLVAEVTVALGVPPATAEDFIDLALLPPAGTTRPARKPRRLAVVTPRPKPAMRGRPRAEGEEELEEEELGLEEELGFGEEEEAAPEEEAEGAEAEGEEEEAPRAAAPAKKEAKPKAAKPKAARPKAAKAKAAGAGAAEGAAAPSAAEAAEAEAAPKAVKKAPAAKARKADAAKAVISPAAAGEEEAEAGEPAATEAKAGRSKAKAEVAPAKKPATKKAKETTVKKAAPATASAAAKKSSARKAEAAPAAEEASRNAGPAGKRK